jgi:hypothetical protein
MTHESSNHEPTFGYLSTVESAEHGYFGGYLVISVLGRPLEFHCSAPVRPSRAQEILYGPTLRPYLLGEQIGGTLLSRAKLTPRLVLADQPATLCLRGQRDAPLVQLLAPETTLRGPDSTSEPQHDQREASASLRRAAPWEHRFTVGDYEFELPLGFAADRDTAAELLAKLAAHVDLAEPFDRIHEAIREAQRIGSRGQDAHGQAA